MTIRNPKAALFLLALSLGFSAGAQNLQEGIKMVQYERYTKAKEILTPLAASDARANYYLGLAELEAGNIDAARAIFVKYPQDPANMSGIARTLLLTGKKTEGTAMAKAVADMAKKKDWEPIMFAADALTYAGGDPQTAVDLYKSALTKTDNVALRIGLGDAYNRMPTGGGEAINNYERASRIDPKTSLGFSRQGILWYQARAFDSALNNLNRAIALDPSNPIPYRELAKAYGRVGKFDLANQNADKYFDLSDKTVDDKIQRANIKFGNKDYATASQIGQELIASGVSKPSLYRLLGWSAYETKDYPAALRNMQTFMASEAAEKVTDQDYLYMGKIYAATSRWDSSDYYFDKALATQTGNKVEAYKDVAEAYKGVKDKQAYAKAGYWFGRAVTENGDKATALDYFNYGVWNYYGEKYDVAEKAFADMEAKFPDQPSATYWRGRVAAAQDPQATSNKALPYYEKWLGVANYDRKPADLMQAYQYMAFYYYNKNDKANAGKYLDLVQSIEPENKFAKDLKAAMNKTPAKPAPRR